MSAAQLGRISPVDWGQRIRQLRRPPAAPAAAQGGGLRISPVIEIGMRGRAARRWRASGRNLETLLRRYPLPVRQVRISMRCPSPSARARHRHGKRQAGGAAGRPRARARLQHFGCPAYSRPPRSTAASSATAAWSTTCRSTSRARWAPRCSSSSTSVSPSPGARCQLGGRLTAQMINILTEQNVQRSPSARWARGRADRTPSQAAHLVGLRAHARTDATGERGEPLAARLAALRCPRPPCAVARRPAAAWQAGGDGHSSASRALRLTSPQRLRGPARIPAGASHFDSARRRGATRAGSRPAATTCARLYLLVSVPRRGLVFDLGQALGSALLPHPASTWRPTFAAAASTSRSATTATGWTLTAASGATSCRSARCRAGTPDLPPPLNWTLGLSNDWFRVGPRRGAAPRHHTLRQRQRRRRQPLQPQERHARHRPRPALGRTRRAAHGPDLRLERTTPEVVTTALSSGDGLSTVRETGLRVAAVVDQPDFANFPTRLPLRCGSGRRAAQPQRAMRARTSRAWAEGTLACAAGATHAQPGTRACSARRRTTLSALGRYTLGGFHQLSGYRSGQLDSNSVVFTRLTWYRRFADGAGIHAGFFVGATLEAGNAWSALERGARTRTAQRHEPSRRGHRPRPVYFDLTYAPQGSAGLYLFVGPGGPCLRPRARSISAAAMRAARARSSAWRRARASASTAARRRRTVEQGRQKAMSASAQTTCVGTRTVTMAAGSCSVWIASSGPVGGRSEDAVVVTGAGETVPPHGQ